jgi:hypothetical protein
MNAQFWEPKNQAAITAKKTFSINHLAELAYLGKKNKSRHKLAKFIEVKTSQIWQKHLALGANFEARGED